MSVEIEWVERAQAYEAAARRRAEAARQHAAEDRRAGNLKHAITFDHEAEVHERVAYMQHVIVDGLQRREMPAVRGPRPRGGGSTRTWATNTKT